MNRVMICDVKFCEGTDGAKAALCQMLFVPALKYAVVRPNIARKNLIELACSSSCSWFLRSDQQF